MTAESPARAVVEQRHRDRSAVHHGWTSYQNAALFASSGDMALVDNTAHLLAKFERDHMHPATPQASAVMDTALEKYLEQSDGFEDVSVAFAAGWSAALSASSRHAEGVCRTCKGTGGITEESGYGVYVGAECPDCPATERTEPVELPYTGDAIDAVQRLLEQGRAVIDADGYLRLAALTLPANTVIPSAELALQRSRDAAVRQRAAVTANAGADVERFVPGPSWYAEQDECWTSEVQFVGGYAVVATVHGATQAEVEHRRDAVLAALANPRPDAGAGDSGEAREIKKPCETCGGVGEYEHPAMPLHHQYSETPEYAVVECPDCDGKGWSWCDDATPSDGAIYAALSPAAGREARTIAKAIIRFVADCPEEIQMLPAIQFLSNRDAFLADAIIASLKGEGN